MGLIKKPSELNVKSEISVMVYGQPGIGKTTLACSAPAPVLFDFDNGVGRINGAHQVDTVQVTCWEEFQQALQEVAEAGDTYKSVIIDTIGKMLAYMEDYIKRTQPKMKQLDGSLNLKGYGVRKQMFMQLLKDAGTWHKNVIFVAHETEIKRGDEIIIRPEISGTAANELIKELDLVGYMQSYGNSRTITFDPADTHYGKNTCNMGGVISIPVVVDGNGNASGSNDFLCRVVESYKARQRDNIEMTAKYERLIQEVKMQADDVQNAEDANNMIEWLKTCDHIYNSPAVAWCILQERCNTLGLKFNKSTKRYAV